MIIYNMPECVYIHMCVYVCMCVCVCMLCPEWSEDLLVILWGFHEVCLGLLAAEKASRGHCTLDKSLKEYQCEVV